MLQKNKVKKEEKYLIDQIAHNWNISKRAAREYLYMFKKQKTK